MERRLQNFFIIILFNYLPFVHIFIGLFYLIITNTAAVLMNKSTNQYTNQLQPSTSSSAFKHK